MVLFLSIALAGGFGFVIFVALKAVQEVVRYYSFHQTTLEGKDLEDMQKAILAERGEIYMFLDRYAEAKGFTWKEFTYNKLTGVLRIK